MHNPGHPEDGDSGGTPLEKIVFNNGDSPMGKGRMCVACGEEHHRAGIGARPPVAGRRTCRGRANNNGCTSEHQLPPSLLHPFQI